MFLDKAHTGGRHLERLWEVSMQVQLINEELLTELHEKAAPSERLCQIFNLWTMPKDGARRMLNALEIGTKVPIHRYEETSETDLCL